MRAVRRGDVFVLGPTVYAGAAHDTLGRWTGTVEQQHAIVTFEPNVRNESPDAERLLPMRFVFER